jgi:single-stranded-DNA-specific exonuclease
VWHSAEVEPDRIRDFQTRLGLSEITARCAASRWQQSPRLQLGPDCFHDPYSIHGMQQAIERLKHAMSRGEHLRIITDYDVDGTTSSLILQSALGLCSDQLTVDYHIPNRFDEGYGFSIKAAQQAINDGVSLIVTADIGIRDHEAVACARAGGVDVLICDHHLSTGDSVPAGAIVLCPPQANCTYPNAHLAACGVSFKLAQALLAEHPKRDRCLSSLLKLAAIGTIADLVPMISDENRAIVQLGLDELNRGPHHPGLAALLQVSGVEVGRIKTSDLGFRIGPRINAAGRLADATMIIKLLRCRDSDAATRMAQQLDQINTERRRVQEQVTKEAIDQISSPIPPFVLATGQEELGWHRGVVGIVASRLKDEYYRPAAVVSIQGENCVGSMRSIDGVHAVECLESARDLLQKFGGHPKAAGFSLPTVHLEALRERLEAFVKQETTPEDFVPKRIYDAEVSLSQLTNQTRKELLSLGPFGMGNPQPRLMLRQVQAEQVEVKGATGRLLKFSLRPKNSAPIEGIWWGQAAHAEQLANQPVDLLGSLQVNEWRGRQTLQLKLDDARLH